MARQRLTNETLHSVQKLAGAREHVRLAESILGPSATDNEVLATARSLSHLTPEQTREINQRRAAIAQQNKRIAAAPDGAEDPWDESGPAQPDPTNNQAYTKQIMTTPDHAVLDSLQKRDKHAPTASRASELSRSARKKYRLAADDEETDEDEETETREAGEDDRALMEHEVEDERKFEDVGDKLKGLEDEEEDMDEEDFADEDEFDDEEEDMQGDEGTDQILDDMEMGGPEDEMEDGEMMEDEMEEDEDHFDLDEDRGELDDMLEMEGDEDFDEDMDEPDIFDMDEGEHELDEHLERGGQAAASRQRRPASRQAGRGRRVGPGRTSGGSRKGTSGGQGPARMSLDEILDVHDEDIERTASTPLEGDDLEALLGARVDRAGRRVATDKRATRESPAAQQRRALLENVWDTENDPELLAGRGGGRTASSQRRPKSAARRPAAPKQRATYAPDRRRVQQSNNSVNEFDQVFGVDGMPDVSKFFD